MSSQKTAPALLSHLSLATAGICLVVAETAFLPEMQLLLGFYLLLVLLPYRQPRRWVLPGWLANLLGLVSVAASLFWFWRRFRQAQQEDGTNWMHDVQLMAAVVPYLGPVLLALLLIRLYRPRDANDFWFLQGIGLLQVLLGCILASHTLFGLALLGYLLVALAALIAHQQWPTESATMVLTHSEPSTSRSDWGELLHAVRIAFNWLVVLLTFTLPLFLLTPRLDSNEWSPLERFGSRSPQTETALTGMSDEIDLTKSGRLEQDDSPAFTVRVRDRLGQPARLPAGEPRWRALVLDRYENGIWSNDLSWPTGTVASGVTSPETHEELTLDFKVPGHLGALVLAEPVLLGPKIGHLPIQRQDEGARRMPLFFEAGGTAIPLTYLVRPEFHYHQYLPARVDRDRYPAVRVRENYIRKISRYQPYPGTEEEPPERQLRHWATQLLLRATEQAPAPYQPLRKALEQQQGAEALPPAVWAAAARLFYEHLIASGQYGYSTTLRRHDLSLDPVLDFLVNVREGTCERFAGALATLLRSQGIPSRIIKGYRGGEFDGRGTYTVLQSHAHAWVEVLVPATGPDEAAPSYEWMIYDPTPGTLLASSLREALAEWWTAQQRNGRLFWQEMILGYSTRQQAGLWAGLLRGRWIRPVLIWLLGVALLILLGWLLRHRKTSRRLSDSLALYERMRKLLRWQRTGGHTPRELALLTCQRLAADPRTAELADVPLGIVDLLYRTRFAGEAVDAEQLSGWKKRLEQLRAVLPRNWKRVPGG